MKRILIAIAALAISLNLAAQTERTKLLSNEEFFEKADFIIEGISTNKNAYSYDINGNYNPNDIYTSAWFVVSYIYKNNSNVSISTGDTLNVILKQGIIYKKIEDQWGYYVDPIESNANKFVLDMANDGPSICFFTNHVLPEDSIVRSNNKYLKVNLLQNKASASIKTQGSIRGLNGLKFPDRDSLYSYMQQFEKFGVDVYMKQIESKSFDTYYEKAEKYYQQKRKEADRFMEIYPKFEIPDSIKGYQLYQYRYDEKMKVDSLMGLYPQINEFLEIQKIKDLSIELVDFIKNRDRKMFEWWNEIDRIINNEGEENNKKKALRVSDTQLWAIVHNQQIYYDNVLNIKYFCRE